MSTSLWLLAILFGSGVRPTVSQAVGPFETEVSRRPIPMDPCIAETLQIWQVKTQYRSSGDWVFANGQIRGGRKPYWGQPLMRNIIRPAAIRLGINGRIGWHTFRHSYSNSLRITGAEIRVMQELLRHASSRMTLDTYPCGNRCEAQSTARGGPEKINAQPVTS